MQKINLICLVSGMIFSIPACKDSGGSSQQLKTSTGEDLRRGYSLTEKKPTNASGLSENNVEKTPVVSTGFSPVLGPNTECLDNQTILYNGYCLELKDFYVWSHKSDGSSFVTHRSFDFCQANLALCSDLSDFDAPLESFRAISPEAQSANSEAYKTLYPVLALTSPEMGQYLTTQETERQYLESEEGFEFAATLFYTAAGSSVGNSKLSRFVKPSLIGRWRYATSLKAQNDFQYDTTFANIQSF